MSARASFGRSLVMAALVAALFPAAALLLSSFVSARDLLQLLLVAGVMLILLGAMAAPGGRRARAFAWGAVLAVAGLVFARWLLTPSLLGGALALWGFGFVASLRCLVPGAEPCIPEDGDPFERARARALALLEEEV